jgi:hypothetical protein
MAIADPRGEEFKGEPSKDALLRWPWALGHAGVMRRHIVLETYSTCVVQQRMRDAVESRS